MSLQKAKINNNNNNNKDPLDAWVIFEHLYGAQRKVWSMINIQNKILLIYDK